MIAGDSVYVRLRGTVPNRIRPRFPGSGSNPTGRTDPPYFETFYYPDSSTRTTRRATTRARSARPTARAARTRSASPARSPTTQPGREHLRLQDPRLGGVVPTGRRATSPSTRPTRRRAATRINIIGNIDMHKLSRRRPHPHERLHQGYREGRRPGDTKPGDLRVGKIESYDGDVTLWRRAPSRRRHQRPRPVGQRS